MPYHQRGDISIYYEIHGSGYPLLLMPPGGMDATIDFWQRTAFNPVSIFSEDFRVIAIDQRNSGKSKGPINENDPWADYLSDHIKLLDHLGIDRCLLLGCCIGASYALRLMVSAPERVAAAVLEQPVGVDESNRKSMPNNWEPWAKALSDTRSDLDPESLAAYGRRMWEKDFVLSVSREDVAACSVPMLVLPGIDSLHPTEIGNEIAALAPHSQLLSPWKEPTELVPKTVKRIREFLLHHASN